MNSGGLPHDPLIEDWALSLACYVAHRERYLTSGVLPGQDRWGEVRRQVAARNLFLYEELQVVLERFQVLGVPVIILKGAALAEGLYPHLGLRYFCDVDFLIRRSDLPKVEKELAGLGYVPFAPLLEPELPEFQSSVNYVKEGLQLIMMEPHWELGRSYPYAGRVDTAGLWARARSARVAGVLSLVLSPEDLALHLCLHLVQHSQGVWLTSACDLAELILRSEATFDWTAFLARVVDWRLQLPVRFALKQTCDLFQPPLPGFVWEQLVAYRPSWFEHRVFALLTNPASKAGPLAHLVSQPGLRAKVKFLTANLFPSREYMAHRYGVAYGFPLFKGYLQRCCYGFRQAYQGLSWFFRPSSPP